FLKTLYTEGLLQFERNQHCWHWQIEVIRARDITSNVVDLLAAKIQQLTPETQHVLKLAACIGNRFDLDTLATVCQQSPSSTLISLQASIQTGLIVPLTDSYKLVLLGVQTQAEVEFKFVHDRIQQAAYSLIPEFDRQQLHYQIGNRLLNHTSSEQQEQHLFDIVNHLNLSLSLLQTPQEQEKVARLNLLAGEKAAESAAYESALKYLQVGLSLLRQETWLQHYDLALALHQAATEAAYLNGNFAQMEQLAETVMQHAATLPDRIKIYEVKMQAYASRTQFLQALEIAIQGLALLGIHFPEPPTPSDIEAAFGETAAKLSGKSIPELIHLPRMINPLTLMAMRLLASANAPAFQAAPMLFPLIILKLVMLSLNYGNTDISALGYGLYGIMLGGIMQQIETSYEFSELALKLLDQFDNPSIRCKTLFVINASVRFRKIHLKETIQPLQEAYQLGITHGDIEFAGYSALHHCDHCFFTGLPLPELKNKLVAYIRSLTQLKELTNADALRAYYQTVLHLTTPSPHPEQLIGTIYDENREIPLLHQANHHKGLFYLYFSKLFLCFLFGKYTEATTAIKLAEPYLDGGRVNAVFP
ncbi:MAG TPA: hypothetical protein V6C65_11025, partial [Allocoleopsis sp.]